MPPDPYGMIPQGIWSDEFSQAGGVSVQDALAQRNAQNQAEQASIADAIASYQSDQQAAQREQQQQAYATADREFTDWPTYQKLVGPTTSDQAYEDYVNSVLPWQLANMGYSQDEIQNELQQFTRLVPSPPKDSGFLGNLYESAKSGFRSGTQATEASAAAATGDLDALARLVTQAAGLQNPAPLARFNQAVAPGEGDDPTSYVQAFKRFGSAATQEPQGLLDFFVQQLTQSYPALVGGGAGALAGSLAGPVGTVGGLVAGTGAGSAALDIGSTILDGLTQAAQDRGVDPTDQQAMLQLLQDPAVRDQVISGGVAHGIPVAAMDAATAAISFGLGGAAARSLRVAARAGRMGLPGARGAAALRGGLQGAGALGSEVVGGAAGERLGQQAQFGQLSSAGDVIAEALGELGPGAAHAGAGAIVSRLRSPNLAPAVPGGAAPVDFNESDLPGAGGGGPTAPLLLPAPGQVPIILGQVVDNVERTINDIPTNPLFDTLDRVSPGWRDNAAASLEEPTPIDSNSPDSIRSFLAERGVTDRSDDVNRAIDLIAQAPDDSKQEAIADVIDNMADSRLAVAEPFTKALLELSRVAPRRTAQQELAGRTVAPSESLLDTIRRTTGQTNAADRSAVTQAWVDHFLSLPRSLEAEQQRRVAVADEAWTQSEETARVESMMELPDNQPVDQAYLDASSQRLDRAIASLSSRTPTSRAKLIQLRQRAQLLLEETVDAYNIRLSERSNAGGGAGGPVGAGGVGVGGGVTAGGRSSTASAITPLHYQLLNTVGGRRSVGTSIGERLIADTLGINPDQVLTTIASALAQEIALSVPIDQTEGSLYRAQAPELYRNKPFEEAAAAEVRQQRTGLRRPASVARRGLRPGELIPTADIVAGQRGPIEANANPQEAEGQPGGGVPPGAAQEGLNQGRGLRRGPANIGVADQGGVGTQPNVTAGAPGVPGVRPLPSGGLPRTVRGTAYPEGQRQTGRPLTTQRTASADATTIEKGLVEEEKRQRLKAQEQRTAEKQKAEKRSLKARERQRQQALNALNEVANEARGLVSPEERVDALRAAYEKLYPGRNYESDTNDLFDATPGTATATLSPSALRTIQNSPFSSVMEYLSAVMASPLQRQVASLIAGLNINVPIKVAPIEGTERGRYSPPSLLPGRNRVEQITIDPTKGDLKTVLHEAIHPATIAALRRPETAQQRDAARYMQELYDHVAQQPGASQHYGMTNIEEFVAEAFSNPQFQKFLHGIALPNVPKVSAWTAFKQFVMQLLGGPSVLSEVLTHGESLLSNRKIGTNETFAEQAPRPVPSTAILGTRDGTRTQIAYAKGDKYVLYDVTPENPRGDPATKQAGLSRQQVEQKIGAAGSQMLPPVADSRPATGVPKNTSTKIVGFGNDGDLKAVAFQQKDGTWTYYESDTDVRTDPDAKVTKGLSQDAAQRYVAAKGYRPEPPKTNAVRPGATTPSPVGYQPAGAFRITYQDDEAALKNIGEAQAARGVPADERIDVLAVLRNSRVRQRIRQIAKQYVEPARAMGAKIADRFNVTQPQIENVLQQLHINERMPNKIRQFQRGNLDPVALSAKIKELEGKQADAQKQLADLRSTNPALVQAIQQDFSPLVKKLSDNTIDTLAQYGILDRQEAENIKAVYDYYVPLQTSDKTTTAKAATGANVSTDRSFARMAEQSMRAIARGEQNRVRQSVVKLAQTTGLINNKDQTNVIHAGASTKVRYDPETNSLNEGVDNHVFDDNSIDVYENGVRTRYTISEPSLLQALHPYKGETRKTVVTAMMQGLAWLNHVVAIGKTAMSPAFGPFNMARDISTALVNMPNGVSRVAYIKQLTNPETYGASFYNTFRDAFGTDMKGRFSGARDAGALIDQRAYIGLDQIANDVNTAFAPSMKQRAKKAGDQTFKILTGLSQFFESTTRYAVYKAAKDSGLSEAGAAHAAKTASVNFEQRGLKNLSNYWIFGNAKVQSLNAFRETLNRKGVGSPTVISATAGMALLGALAAAAGLKYSDRDKDGKSKYSKIPDYKKDSMVLFQEGAAGVPIPQEISPFYILGNAMMELKALGGDKSPSEVTSRITTSILNQYWPGNVPQQDIAGHKARQAEFLARVMLPSQLMPVMDIAMNRNTFGSPVVSGKEDKLKKGIPLRDMGSANESQLAVNAAQGLYAATGVDVAPQQLRLLNAYYDPAAEPMAFVRDLLGLREEKYQGDVVNPLVRKFTGNATQFYDQDQFDELLAKATQAKYLAEKPGGGGITSLPIEDQVLARSATMLSKVQSDANSLFRDNKLLSKERRDLLNDRKQELILDGIRRYNELRDRTVRAQPGG